MIFLKNLQPGLSCIMLVALHSFHLARKSINIYLDKEVDIHLSIKHSDTKEKTNHVDVYFNVLGAAGLCASVPSPKPGYTSVEIIVLIRFT